MGYSPQQNALYEFLTLKENIKVFGKLKGLSSDEINQNSKKLLEILDLKHSLDKPIKALSGGMQKRADLLCALINDPPIIILDEPFNGLDISLQKFIWDFIRKQGKKGKIVIITSHILSDIQRYCNKFGLIERNNFYGTQNIFDSLKKSGYNNLGEFLAKLFMRDIEQE